MSVKAELFRRASQVMSERGQCKGDLEDSSGRVCLYGALQVAAVERQERWLASYFAACDVADDLILAFDPTSTTNDAPRWNDQPARTQTEVEKFLLWAADRIDADAAGA